MTSAPPFFIMGCPRSGTTLASQLLDAHPRVSVLVETLYYTLFRDNLKYYGDLGVSRNARFLCQDLREMTLLHGLHRGEVPALDDVMSRLKSARFGGVLAAFLQAYAELQGKSRAGEKTARHYEYAAQIVAEFPNSPIIYVMRDPRDVVRSIRKMFGIALPDAITWWNRAFQSYQQLLAAGSTPFLLEYERLVADPVPVLSRLCEFLGERYAPEMLKFHERLPQALAQAQHHEQLGSGVHAASVGSHRALPGPELAAIEAGCAAGMAALGYAPRSARAQGSVTATLRPSGPVRRRLQRLTRLMLRPDIRYFGWRRWKMRARARLRYHAGKVE